jgi:hypothetical protein
MLPLPSRPADERLAEAALTIEQIAARDVRLYFESKQKGTPRAISAGYAAGRRSGSPPLTNKSNDIINRSPAL